MLTVWYVTGSELSCSKVIERNSFKNVGTFHFKMEGWFVII